MCFTKEQAKELLRDWNLTEEHLTEQLSYTAGEIFGWRPDDYKDPAKRKEVVISTLENIATTFRRMWEPGNIAERGKIPEQD